MAKWTRAASGRDTPLGGFDPFLPALVTGATLVFSFPTFDIGYLAWFALVPFLYSLRKLEPWDAFRSGLLMGLVYFFGTQFWIYHSVHNYGGVPFIASIFIVLFLALVQSSVIAAFAVIFSIKLRSVRLPAFVLAPVLWVPFEYLRGFLFTGFPWSSLGYTQYEFLHVIQIADMTGMYGVSFLVVAVNGALTDVLITMRQYRERPLYSSSTAVAGVVTVAVLFGAAYYYGERRLAEERPGEEVTVSVIQGNIAQDEKWDKAHMREILDIYKQLTVSAPSGAASTPISASTPDKEGVSDTLKGASGTSKGASGTSRPELVVWPEAAVPFLWNSADELDVELAKELRRFQSGRNSYLLFGAVRVLGPGELTNSAIMLDGSGRETYRYDKIHLVPFGEYVPFKRILFFLDKLVSGIGDYRAGEKHTRGVTPFGEFGTLICYEIIFPGLVRKFFSDGGDFMVTITNDAWFGRTSGPHQHFAMAAFRAVENRKPLIRAANSGISGFFDSNGRIIKRTKLFERRALTSVIKTDRTRTFYSRYGDLFTYVNFVLSILIIFYTRR